jgi:CHAD domain-containing protein
VRQTLEREVKLEPGDAGFALPELPGEQLASRIFTSTYFDTPPRSLARVGITLRRRLENGVSLWQLKLPREHGRAEVEAPGGPAGPPDEVRSLLFAHLRHGAVEPVATLRTRRTGVRVLDHGLAVADVTLDSVDVMDGNRTAGGFAEIEVELVDGSDDDLDRLARTLRRAGAARSSGEPKLMRVLAVAHDPAPRRKAAAVEHLGYLLGHKLRMLEAYDPGVRLGGDDEDLHRLRVATRRSRALLRAARAFFGDRLEGLNAELKWLGGVLGPVRDLDVLLAHLRAETSALDDDAAGILAALEAERSAARAALLEALRGERYRALLDRFELEVAALPPLDAEPKLGALARRDGKRLQKAFSRLGDAPSDDALHEARIRAKRARYTSELAAATGGKRFQKAVTALKDLQDTIGAHQDAVVAEEKIRSVAGTLAAGRLVERERARRARARADVPAVWRRVDRAVAKL